MVIIIAKVIVRVTEITNKNIHIYILQIGTSLYYKLGEILYYNLGQVLLQIIAAIIN